MNDFMVSYSGHFEYPDSHDDAYFPSVDTLNYAKSHFNMTTVILNIYIKKLYYIYISLTF